MLQFNKTGYYFQQRRFAGTVGTNDDKKITFLNRKGEAVQHNQTVIGMAQVLYINGEIQRLDLFNKYIKSGAPIKAVITPAGISPCRGNILANKSQNTM